MKHTSLVQEFATLLLDESKDTVLRFMSGVEGSAKEKMDLYIESEVLKVTNLCFAKGLSKDATLKMIARTWEALDSVGKGTVN